MNAFIDRLYPSRSAPLRPGSDSEIRQMSVVETIIEEASAKQRAAGVNRMAEDEGWDAWSGVIPIETRIGAPMADAVQSAGAAADLGPYVEGARLDEALTRAARE